MVNYGKSYRNGVFTYESAFSQIYIRFAFIRLQWGCCQYDCPEQLWNRTFALSARVPVCCFHIFYWEKQANISRTQKILYTALRRRMRYRRNVDSAVWSLPENQCEHCHALHVFWSRHRNGSFPLPVQGEADPPEGCQFSACSFWNGTDKRAACWKQLWYFWPFLRNPLRHYLCSSNFL